MVSSWMVHLESVEERERKKNISDIMTWDESGRYNIVLCPNYNLNNCDVHFFGMYVVCIF